MFNTPPHFSVEQLLHARQNGVPDYVVVPLLQKTIAVKNAAQAQAAMQAQPTKPPIAQQVLGAAQQYQAREAGIAQLQAQQAQMPQEQQTPEGHARGGMLAFAEGGEMPSDEEFAAGEAEFAPPQAPDESGIASIKKYSDAYKSILGPDESAARSQQVLEKRQKEHEANKAQAPWMALMKAGAAMAQSKSPDFMSALGEGIGAGSDAYISGKQELDREGASIEDMDIGIARAKRAEQVAVMNHGYASAQAEAARKQAAALAQAKMAMTERHYRATEEEAKRYHTGTMSNQEMNAEANVFRAHKPTGGGGGGGAAGGKPMTEAQRLSYNMRVAKMDQAYIDNNYGASPEEAHTATMKLLSQSGGAAPKAGSQNSTSYEKPKASKTFLQLMGQ